MNNLTFENLPAAVEKLQLDVSEILQRIEKLEPSKDRLMITTEAAQFLTLSRASIYRLVNGRSIPFHKVHGRLYFLEAEILAWVKAGKKSPL